MIRKKGFGVLVFASLFMGLVVRSQGLVTQIIYVKDLQQTPIHLASFTSQGSFLDARGNSEGMYRLLLPSNGSYTLEIRAPYFETTLISFTLTDASKGPIQVVLSPSSFRGDTLLEDGTDALTWSESDLDGLGDCFSKIML